MLTGKVWGITICTIEEFKTSNAFFLFPRVNLDVARMGEGLMTQMTSHYVALADANKGCVHFFDNHSMYHVSCVISHNSELVSYSFSGWKSKLKYSHVPYIKQPRWFIVWSGTGAYYEIFCLYCQISMMWCHWLQYLFLWTRNKKTISKIKRCLNSLSSRLLIKMKKGA
jgi:hypothetical protein